MSEPGNKLQGRVDTSVVDYVARLGELVALCHRYADKDAEIFLWNSRRVLEVVCHILITVKTGEVSRDEGEAGDMQKRIHGLKEKRLISAELQTSMDTIRRHSNLGVHIRSPEKEDYPFALKHVREQLPDVVDWLFDDSIACEYIERPDALNGHLEAIRGRRAEPLPELTAHTQPVVTAPPPPPIASSRIPAVALGVLLGAGLIAGWRFVSGERLGPGTMATASLSTTATEVAATASPTKAPPPLEVAPLSCTDGMVLIQGTRLRLGPPEGGRQDWPRAARSVLDDVEVAPFCIDATARSWVQFADWPQSIRLNDSDCSWRNRDTKEPVVCLTRSEASEYCGDRGARLPTILEWEAMQRSPESRAKPSAVREWVADEFPPTALGYRPDPTQSEKYGLFRQKLGNEVDGDGHPLSSWNRQELNNRWSNLGFRCAASPS